MSTFDHVTEAAEWLRGHGYGGADVAIVLGSGLGDFAEGFSEPMTTPYAEIPHWPASHVIGHAGKLVGGTIARPARAGALRPRAHVRRAQPADGDLCDESDGSAGRSSRDPHQRRRRYHGEVLARHAHGHRRPHQSDGQQPAGRTERGAVGPPVSGHDRGLLQAPATDRRRGGAPNSSSACSTASTSPSTVRATRRRLRFARSASSAPMPWACRRRLKPSSRVTWASRSSESRASPTLRPACSRSRCIIRGDGDGAHGEGAVHRPAGGDHWPALMRWFPPRATRASMPSPTTRISRSAPRSRRLTASSSPAATSRTRPTA